MHILCGYKSILLEFKNKFFIFIYPENLELDDKGKCWKESGKMIYDSEAENIHNFLTKNLYYTSKNP